MSKNKHSSQPASREEALRALIAEANGVTKDLLAAMKQARAMAHAIAREVTETQFKPFVRQSMAEVTAALGATIEKSDRVIAQRTDLAVQEVNETIGRVIATRRAEVESTHGAVLSDPDQLARAHRAAIDAGAPEDVVAQIAELEFLARQRKILQTVPGKNYVASEGQIGTVVVPFHLYQPGQHDDARACEKSESP